MIERLLKNQTYNSNTGVLETQFQWSTIFIFSWMRGRHTRWSSLVWPGRHHQHTALVSSTLYLNKKFQQTIPFLKHIMMLAFEIIKLSVKRSQRLFLTFIFIYLYWMYLNYLKFIINFRSILALFRYYIKILRRK